MLKTPKITLLGGGIGDPELITVKGLKALENADVVLYDALANDALLAHCPAHCRKIFVGKRAHNHELPQDDINTLLVTEARQYGHVVRLKGGDPYVFGRGHEELEKARAESIAVEIIPGVSSSIAVPALAGVPVTRRGMSDSFWVLTGCNTEGVASDELKMAAKTNATVVLLMGVGKIKRIMDVYRAEGRHALPVAVIQNGSLPEQKVVVGTVETIEEDIKLAQLGTPAVIVIGEVAALANSSFDTANADLKAKGEAVRVPKLPVSGGGNGEMPRQNNLFPIFLKLHELRLLIVGGGYVGLEKITSVLQNSPLANVTMVSPEIRPEIVEMVQQHPNVQLVYKKFETKDLADKDLVIVATNDKELNRQIKGWTRQIGILCNVADTPDSCDFYLSSVVKKGSLKLAISTDGQSPTMAKRIREAMEDVFPDDLETVFANLRHIRTQLKGDFEHKVQVLNEITRAWQGEKKG